MQAEQENKWSGGEENETSKNDDINNKEINSIKQIGEEAMEEEEEVDEKELEISRIYLLMLKLTEFIWCFLLSLFPPWNLQAYKNRNQHLIEIREKELAQRSKVEEVEEEEENQSEGFQKSYADENHNTID